MVVSSLVDEKTKVSKSNHETRKTRCLLCACCLYACIFSLASSQWDAN